jgi:uncharacterized membrane protein
MKPIVNPVIIYLINLMGSLRVGFIFGAVIFAILTIFCAVEYEDLKESNSNEDKQMTKKFFRASKRFLVCFVLTFILIVFVPSKDTCIEMIVASYVTPDNIDAGVEKTKETVDYIIDKIKEVSE